MIYLNSLSITSLQSLLGSQDSLKKTMEFLSLIEGKFLLCVPFNNPNYIIQDNISLKQAVNHITDIDLKSLLTTILTDSTTYLGEYPSDYFHQGKNSFFSAFDTYLAMNDQDCIILSLHSEAYWVNNTIPLINNSVISNHFNCPTTNFSTFIDGIHVWEPLIKKFIMNKKKQGGYLCHAISVKHLIPSDIYSIYLQEINDPNVKITNIRSMAKFVAECCGYDFMQDISNRNRTGSIIRDIYFNSEKDVYISTDINHGRFEVLDNNGTHICEIDFEGTQTKPRDTTRRHNIRL